MQLIITWVSWSWKTTIMRNLLRKYPEIYGKPIQYTTRKPRSDSELDEYIFLTHEQFIKKLTNWDFIEYVEYNWELYAVSVYFDREKVNIFIAEPVGRESLKKYFKLNWVKYVAAYISLDEDEVKKRLEQRGSNVWEIKKRLNDFKYFSSSEWDKIIQWNHSQDNVTEQIHKYVVKWVSSQT